ncbi:MAG: hypothetical protein IIY21_04330 [Clostridiales bacterium]|nr:hypothetical protein [Clostridiales bacterium]MBQ1573887.1 hypothetical protein [Clostridiales bacterium]
MELKNTTTMIIGLVISVVLVAGLMVPVISSLGSGGGGEEAQYTNTGEIYFASGNQSLTLTAENADAFTVTATKDGNEIIKEQFSGSTFMMDPPYPSHILAWGNDWILAYDLTYSSLMGTEEWEISLMVMSSDMEKVDLTQRIRVPTNETRVFEIESANGTLTIHRGENADELSGFNGMRSSEGDSVLASAPYVMSDTVFAGINTDQSNGFTIFGTIDSATTMMMLGGDVEFTTTAVDGAYRIDSAIATDVDGVDEPIPLDHYIVPVQIGGGSGSGSSVPPTLMALISVIPLITVVGIVMGTIGYIRMKE